MSYPVIAIVGRPNVGKSSLFNALTQTRNALVAAEAGLTRDRQYGIVQNEGQPYLLVDTGGLINDSDALAGLMARQAQFAMDEADLIVFMADARDGLLPDDEVIAERLRRAGKPVFVVVNKTDGLDEDVALGDFHGLGLGSPLGVSVAHRRGIGTLEETLLGALPSADASAQPLASGVRMVLLGRPNAGKSTLANRLVGEERVLIQDAPGTTRDSIEIPFSRDGEDYVLVDTAGVRRRAKVPDGVEKLSAIKSLQAVYDADVAVVMLEARREVSDQDAHLIGHVLETGRALVIAVNKWDGLDDYQRSRIKAQLERKLGFVSFAPIVFISALHGRGLRELMAAVRKVYQDTHEEMSTAQLTRILEQIVTAHPPPMVGGRAPKLRYAHSGGQNPLRVIVHGNRLERLPESYRRYLVNCFRKGLGVDNAPLQVLFRGGDNPFAGRRNKLSDRQQQKRKRLMRHGKRR